jgi:hypothetical protein
VNGIIEQADHQQSRDRFTYQNDKASQRDHPPLLFLSYSFLPPFQEEMAFLAYEMVLSLGECVIFFYFPYSDRCSKGPVEMVQSIALTDSDNSAKDLS